MTYLFKKLPRVPFLLIIIIPQGKVENESPFGKLEDRIVSYLMVHKTSTLQKLLLSK